jgi:quinol monooxygenase YgiN
MRAKAGKEQMVQAFLRQGAIMSQDETQTQRWFGIDEGDGVFSVFDTFEDEEGREAHLEGAIAKALMGSADELFIEPPQISKVKIVAEK